MCLLHTFHRQWTGHYRDQLDQQDRSSTELRLKKKVISDSRKKLESLGHVHKRVAIHLRVTDASRMDMYN